MDVSMYVRCRINGYLDRITLLPFPRWPYGRETPRLRLPLPLSYHLLLLPCIIVFFTRILYFYLGSILPLLVSRCIIMCISCVSHVHMHGPSMSPCSSAQCLVQCLHVSILHLSVPPMSGVYYSTDIQ